jgi:hypothetical protein
MPISDRDLRYLHRQKKDQSKWSWRIVEYFVVDEATTTVDRMTKEPLPGVGTAYPYPTNPTAKLPARMKVTPPRTYGDPRTGGAVTLEHSIIFSFAAKDLEDAGITPRHGDKIVIEPNVVEYRVKQPRLDKFVAKAPFNLEMEIEVTRIEIDEAVNPDLPQPVSRGE